MRAALSRSASLLHPSQQRSEVESSCSASSFTRTDAPALQPLAPVLWKDWPRCGIQRTWLKVIRSQTVGLTESLATPTLSLVTISSETVLTRAQRAHWRLSWEQRLARNARPADAHRLLVTLHGLPATFAHSFGEATSEERRDMVWSLLNRDDLATQHSKADTRRTGRDIRVIESRCPLQRSRPAVWNQRCISVETCRAGRCCIAA